MEEQGFYTKKRTLSAPLKARSKLSFGEAVPIELPTMREHHLDCEGWDSCQTVSFHFIVFPAAY